MDWRDALKRVLIAAGKVAIAEALKEAATIAVDETVGKKQIGDGSSRGSNVTRLSTKRKSS